MIKKIIFSICIVSLTGCASTTPRIYQPVNPVVERVVLIHPPALPQRYRLNSANDPALEKAFNVYIKTGKASHIVTDGFMRFAYNSDQQPIVKTNPLQETVISLEPGERFTNVTTGDPSRWSYAAAISGAGGNQQMNILVKPSQPNIATNMVITTDKRVYNIKLISTSDGRLTRNVRFWYPEEMVAHINHEMIKNAESQTVEQVPDVSLNHLNFDYCISQKGFFSRFPSWKPVRVFDDGTHTYIQFPELMKHRDMPVLFIRNKDNKELVNYRSKPPYFVVDKIFKEAILVMGVGSDQQTVIITNNRY